MKLLHIWKRLKNKNQPKMRINRIKNKNNQNNNKNNSQKIKTKKHNNLT
jgi:hypothetical protein